MLVCLSHQAWRKLSPQLLKANCQNKPLMRRLFCCLDRWCKLVQELSWLLRFGFFLLVVVLYCSCVALRYIQPNISSLNICIILGFDIFPKSTYARILLVRNFLVHCSALPARLSVLNTTKTMINFPWNKALRLLTSQ